MRNKRKAAARTLSSRKGNSINQHRRNRGNYPCTKREMEGIEHRTVEVNGIKMHVEEKGEGPVVLFLHGFPELWHSWHNQILALASVGYRAVAPDLRGYGDTEAPASISSYTCFHIVLIWLRL